MSLRRVPTTVLCLSTPQKRDPKALRENKRPGRRHDAVAQLLRIDRGAYASLVGSSEFEEGESLERERWSDVVRVFGDAVTVMWDRERREMTCMVSGVTRLRKRLDYVLSCYTKKPLKKLHRTAVLQILRLGVYELLEMEKPSHVVYEHVDLAKEYGMEKLVNAILRSLIRDMDAGTVPEPKLNMEASEAEISSDLSVVYSHPEWMIERWLMSFGLQDTVRLMQHNNSQPCQGIRCTGNATPADVLPALLADDIEAEISPYLPSFFLRVHSGLQSILQPTHNTRFAVQDEAAGLVVAHMLMPEPGDRILDCCAAIGGKLFFTARLMENAGTLVALEPKHARMKRMRNMASVYGFRFIEFHCQTLQAFAEMQLDQLRKENMLFDKVLLDVPCSGTGVMAKKADLRWKRRQQDIPNLCTLQVPSLPFTPPLENGHVQDELLHTASQLVKPGGILVYSTCSIEREENQDRIHAFLASHPEFTLHLPSTPQQLEQTSPAIITPQGFLQSLPHHHGIDGAFAARLQSPCT